MSSPTQTKTRPRTRGANRQRLLLAVLAGIVVLAGVAVVLTPGGNDDAATVAAPEVAGQLPPLPEDGADPAVAAPAPMVEGSNFDGEPVAIRDDGRAKIILLLAHWCSVCQEEVPVVQNWLAGGGLPEDVDLYSVATAIDPQRPNYPPQEWLERAGWQAPVIVDREGTVAEAYGLTAFPFWLFVYPDGTVAARTIGALPAETLDQAAAQLVQAGQAQGGEAAADAEAAGN